jgi:hypothetical protein
MTGHPFDATGGHAMPPTQTATKEYVRRVRLACDDLHDEPLNPTAREALLKVLTEDVPADGPALHQRQG